MTTRASHARVREAVRGELPERAHDAGRLGIGRALGGALRAAVAVPDLLVGGEAVLQAKPDESHLAAGEEPFLTGKVARRRASAALQARLERRQVQAVGLEERAVGAGGEIERPVRQQVDGPATEKPTEVTRRRPSGASRLLDPSMLTLLQYRGNQANL